MVLVCALHREHNSSICHTMPEPDHAEVQTVVVNTAVHKAGRLHQVQAFPNVRSRVDHKPY